MKQEKDKVTLMNFIVTLVFISGLAMKIMITYTTLKVLEVLTISNVHMRLFYLFGGIWLCSEIIRSMGNIINLYWDEEDKKK